MTSLEYYQLAGFEQVYLEDSYVLDIEESEDAVIFSLDLVLAEKHPAYTSPKPGEQYCYKSDFLRFENVFEVNWIAHTLNPFTDANNEVDYGNIDAMTCMNGKYRLSGDWEELEITSSPPVIDFVD